MLHIGSLIQTLAKGGPVMIPLVICSVLALAVVVERLGFWWRQGDVGPAERALELAERGADFIETMAVERMIAAFRDTTAPAG